MKKMCIVLMGLMIVLSVATSAMADKSTTENVNDSDTNAAAPVIILPSLVEKLNRGEETFSVIVLLKGHKEYVGKIKTDRPAEMRRCQSEIHGKQDLVLNRLGSPHFILKYRFNNILGFAGKVSRYGIEALSSMPEVAIIEEDQQLEAQTSQGIDVMTTIGSTVYGRSAYQGFLGDNVSIAIVDYGIDYNHSKLGDGGFPNNKVIGGYDEGNLDGDPMDENSHGTGVAGIAAGSLSSGTGGYRGAISEVLFQTRSFML